MDRRRFLHHTAFLGAGLGPLPAPPLDPTTRQARRLAGVLGHPGRAARVGRAYLRAHPAEARLGRLISGLTAGWPEDAAQLEGRGQLRARLRRAIRADFAAGRTVSVGGWVLAASEARLFAIAALVA